MNKKNNNQYPIENYLNNLSPKPNWLLSIIQKLVPFSMIWVSLVLMYGVICMYTNMMGQDEFYRFIFFLQSPFVIVLNCIALLGAIYHSIHWFNLAPNVVFSANSTKTTKCYLLTAGLWFVSIIISICLLLFILR
ncbi:hypothetical protein J3U57_05075 [Gilliamella sp. B3464]|uniref:hypothetical protein n=1 Tax=unclassified Gilliamella TaxID=2685620 RepID=UPI00226AEBE5|nr:MULTISPECIES: hypothetical protein [unclassified Gilliamella]MCX8711896.1 hypothetical protein [Gilliamella sp. B3468]MCX8738590.1 hypothetical protein [Gilliamella sp. B2824]MCX8750946.1 hypothetical protein [Gilliamella sp. B3464]